MVRTHWRLMLIITTKNLFPVEGEAETVEGELLRAINRLYYEFTKQR